MSAPTDLAAKMRARADTDDLPPEHELRSAADAFDAATLGFYAEPQTVPVAKFMGAWAKARRLWCDHTGDSLL